VADFVTPDCLFWSAIRLLFVRLKRSARFGPTERPGKGSPVLSNWLPFLIYGFFAAAIPASMLAMTFLFATRPKARVRQRMVPFESGVSAGPPSQHRRFTVSFYLTAMLFILFDIEIVFLYPLAIQLNALGWFGLVEFLTFIAILVVAYVYIWRKGALEWH
jgi:NADH-quinone oxidoreductase subunit A